MADRARPRGGDEATRAREADDAEWRRRFGPDRQAKSSEYEWGKRDEADEAEPAKVKKNFATSGALSKDARTDERTGIEVKYVEPENSVVPRLKWRLYPFKNDQPLEPYKVHRKSWYLLGRDRHVCDIPLDHPSCSKQHAVLQYRLVRYEDEETGKSVQTIRPYVIDLGSTNGTFLNGVKVDDARYIELMEKDILKFGNSSREFVFLHEGSGKGTPDEQD